MKIVSWNIGNFIWLKYFPGKKHYAFQRENLHDVATLLKNEDADIMFLQEIPEGEDAALISEFFPNHRFVHAINGCEIGFISLFLSKYPIQEVHHTNSNDYIINGVTFFPIHLNAFSPQKRHDAVDRLLIDLPMTRGLILGDTNFWIYEGTFFSKRDKISYAKIMKGHTDILKSHGPTCRILLSLDKIFVTNDLSYSNQKITHHTIGHVDHYMISTNISLQ